MNIVPIDRKVIDFVKWPYQTCIPALFALLGGMFFFRAPHFSLGRLRCLE